MGIETWMPLYTADILASCAEMSASQFGGYMRLICYAWSSGGLPNDQEACCRIAGGLSPADWSVVRRRLIVLDEGTSEERLSQGRLEQERSKQQAKHTAKLEAIAKARAAKAALNNGNRTDNSPDNSLVDSPVNRTEPEPELEPELEPDPDCIRNAIPSELLGATRQKPRRTKPRTYRVSWSESGGFHGILDADIANWKAAYPSVDLTVETSRAHAWLVSKPSKQGKRNWLSFLNGWFSRAHERGGSANLPAPPKKTFRPDAGREMTASEYAEWKRASEREEFLRSKARKRSGLSSLGEAIDERLGER